MKSREITNRDIDGILALNESSIFYLSPLSHERLADLLKQAVYQKAVEIDGRMVSFILAFDHAALYDSPNYLWFKRRYRNFLYIDRIVVQKEFRLKGVADYLYRQLFHFAREKNYAWIACEIDIDPPNVGSLKFHEKYKFFEVGRQRPYNGKKEVSLRVAKIMPC
jgi:predicted GNAT superfamily acetyltransferase